MKDIQSSMDQRGIAIQRVGIKGAFLPFLIKAKDGGYQQVTAKVSFAVALPMEYKGTHMSRFLEILNPWSKKPVAEAELFEILQEALDKLQAEAASIRIEFKYFVDRKAPVSGKASVLDVDCVFAGSMQKGSSLDFMLGVSLPYTSLCPCSKEISRYGAHNQRGVMNVELRYKPEYECIWIENLVELLEKQASCQVYPLLKREDEKFVTEKAYENPKFVEDILRDGVLALRELSKDGLQWFSLECENFESIHNHSAYAAHEETIGE